MNSLEFKTHLKHEQIRSARAMAIIGSLAYPIWYFLFLYFEPNIVDPLWSRILCYVVLWGSAGFLLMSNADHKFAPWVMVAAGGSITLHHFFVAASNEISLLYTAGGLIVVPTVISALPYLRFAMGFTALFMVVPSIYGWMFAHEPVQWFYALGLPTAAFIAGLHEVSRHRMLGHIERAVKHQEWILSNMLEGVVLKDHDGKIFAANPAAERILGLKSNELEGKTPTDGTFHFVYEDGSFRPGETCPSIVSLRTGTKQLDQALGIQRPDGQTTWININAQPIFNEREASPSAVLVSFVDVTERRNAERLLQEQQARLMSASKMSALGEMAAGIAHEINNPLAIISGRINQLQRMLEKKQDDPDKRNQLFQNIESTVERISKIVQGLRSFARDSAKDPLMPWPLQKVVEETLALCKERFTKNNIQLEVQDIDPSVSVDCRPGEISQILLNLLQNAFDAVEEQKNDRRVSLSIQQEQGFVALRVEDSGPGIPSEIRAKIMQPFFTTKPVGKGTGLGLSISMGIAEAHGGRLFLDDAAKTTFVLRLPRSSSASRTSAA